MGRRLQFQWVDEAVEEFTQGKLPLGKLLQRLTLKPSPNRLEQSPISGETAEEFESRMAEHLVKHLNEVAVELQRAKGAVTDLPNLAGQPGLFVSTLKWTLQDVYEQLGRPLLRRSLPLNLYDGYKSDHIKEQTNKRKANSPTRARQYNDKIRHEAPLSQSDDGDAVLERNFCRFCVGEIELAAGICPKCGVAYSTWKFPMGEPPTGGPLLRSRKRSYVDRLKEGFSILAERGDTDQAHNPGQGKKRLVGRQQTSLLLDAENSILHNIAEWQGERVEELLKPIKNVQLRDVLYRIAFAEDHRPLHGEFKRQCEARGYNYDAMRKQLERERKKMSAKRKIPPSE